MRGQARTVDGRRPTGLALSIVLLMSAAVPPPIPAAARAATPAVAQQPAAPPGRDLAEVSPRWWDGTDFLVTGRGDANGYHLWLGLERERYALRPLASIRPNGYADDEWLGYQCVTGDGRHVAVTVAPRRAINRPVVRDRGGLTYLVDIRTGKVRPVVHGIAFKYHATGCGTGSAVALLRHLDTDQRRTELLRLDATTGKVTRVATVDGQVTSAVPSGTGLLALRGRAVVRVTAGASASEVVAKVGGEPFRLTATPDGADLLVRNGPTVDVQRWDGARLSRIGAGPAGRVQLHGGLAGKNVTVGVHGHAGHAGHHEVGGSATNARAVSVQGKVVLAPADGPAAGGRHHDEANLTGTALFWAADGTRLDWEPSPGVAASTMRAVPATNGGTVARSAQAWDQTPKCGVPRNNPRRQAYNPTPEQTRWAVEMASRNLLVGALGRPANHLNAQLAAYSPSNDFRVPDLLPAGGSIPPAVMNGILAQESNYNHASWRVLRGSGGNSLIGDYYGAKYTIDLIDYPNADCGYGIAQVTTGMEAADPSITPNGKAKIAIDYAENIQAGLGILAKKWNQLYSAGIKMNDSNPSLVENWYLALWAYNSGVNPQAHTGGTGCTPGPSCTDPDGNWGLGWTNNPMNADYPPDRDVFLRTSYADAERPSDWPYQERVLGWAETPIQIPWGVSAYTPAQAGPGGDPERPITYPARTTFCTANSDCSPTHDPAGDDHDFCTRQDFHCWWHEPVSTGDCARYCATSPFLLAPGTTEPVARNPWAPACDSDVGAGAVIVDELADPSANLYCPSRNWSNRGAFTYQVGGDPATGAPLGEIDFHQLSTGFGGHTWMTGNRLSVDAGHRVTGTWTPTGLAAGTYVVKAHIPVAGASAGSAVYEITTASGEVRQKVINQHEHWNHWKSLGTYQLGGNAKVTLSNTTRDDGTGGVGTVAYDAVAFVPAAGRAVEERIDAVAFFDENQNIDMNAPSAVPLNTPLESRQKLYDWGLKHASNVVALSACTSGPRADCAMPATKLAGARWLNQVVGAGTDPVAHPRGESLPAWMGLSNEVGYRPTSTAEPAHFTTDDAAYKIRSSMRFSYVVGADGKIVDGSGDVDYDQRTADTHMPRFVMEFLRAMQSDYGITLPNLTYTTTNLNEYDHKSTTAQPQYDGILPGRSFRYAGWKPIVTDQAGNPVHSGASCVLGLFSSGGLIGFRPMIGAKAPSVAMEAWGRRLIDTSTVPDKVADIGAEIYNMFFKYGLDGSLFGASPPIWQELYIRACTDGTTETIRPGNSGANQKPMVSYSFMPSQYLYRNGRAMAADGSTWNSASPVTQGDFNSFTRMPGVPGGENPFGQCDHSTRGGSGGNPWSLAVTPDGRFQPEIEPPLVRFCLDPSWESDPDIS